MIRRGSSLFLWLLLLLLHYFVRFHCVFCVFLLFVFFLVFSCARITLVYILLHTVCAMDGFCLELLFLHCLGCLGLCYACVFVNALTMKSAINFTPEIYYMIIEIYSISKKKKNKNNNNTFMPGKHWAFYGKSHIFFMSPFFFFFCIFIFCFIFRFCAWNRFIRTSSLWKRGVCLLACVLNFSFSCYFVCVKYYLTSVDSLI